MADKRVKQALLLLQCHLLPSAPAASGTRPQISRGPRARHGRQQMALQRQCKGPNGTGEERGGGRGRAFSVGRTGRFCGACRIATEGTTARRGRKGMLRRFPVAAICPLLLGKRWRELNRSLEVAFFCHDDGRKVTAYQLLAVMRNEENDLVEKTGLDLMKSMKRDLEEIRSRWRGCHVVLTAFVPRWVWRGAKKPSAIERAKRKLNKEMRCYCVDRGFTFMEHKDLRFEDVEFFRGDGVHLSFMGMDLHLLHMKETLKAMLQEV
ncbi:hypothetical protein NDU88_003880 [Pleurodeles waltl]|uniref:Uncharacterized protein n=1 Tax=Pleurodeles waltl TaxID=8319 RepID=A0AAV7PFV3_PLEWA|nr:hypothetical protein NDU88_003880 [Pleurodeles waltl]